MRGGSTKYTHLITESAVALITESALFVLPIKQNTHVHKHQTQTFRQGRWHQTSLASVW